MTKPSQLIEHQSPTIVFFFQDLIVWNSILPCHFEDALQASNVERFQHFQMLSINGPCFTSIQEGGKADCPKYTNLCVYCRSKLVLKNTLFLNLPNEEA